MIQREAVLASQGMATRVKRWHTWPMLSADTVGRHSCRAALIYLELWNIPRAEVLVWLLRHDLGELTAGDTPSYAKQQWQPLKDALDEVEIMGRATQSAGLPLLCGDEPLKCKIADALETWETALFETKMGNQYAECAMVLMSQSIRILIDDSYCSNDEKYHLRTAVGLFMNGKQK